MAGTDQRPEGIPPRESSPGEEEKDQLPQVRSPPQAPPRAKAPAHPVPQRGRLAEWGSLPLLPLLSGSPDSSRLPSQCPCWAGSHCCHLPTWTRGRPGPLPKPAEPPQLTGSPRHPWPQACPPPTSPRTPTAGRPGRTPPAPAPPPRTAGDCLGLAQAASPACWPASSLPRQRHLLPPPPTVLLPRGLVPKLLTPPAGPRGPCDTEGTREGSGLRCGGSEKSWETSGGWRRVHAGTPTPDPNTHTHSNTLTHAHWPFLSTH